MRKLGLYIHIPFCQQKCNYCDFYSFSASDKEKKEYVDALCTHIEREAQDYKGCEFDTVYIGGGTPSILEPELFNRLGNTIKKCLKLTQGAEFSIEINPGTLSAEKLLAYKKIGVNRLSIGLQSANDKELVALGRIHTLEDFEKSYYLARKNGFENVSIDLMYGLPNQTKEDFLKTLNKVISYNPEHISAYCLKIEDNTLFGRIKDTLTLPSEDEEYETYLSLVDTLEKNGYLQYEISNFSKAGYRSLHNMKYWLSHEYVAFGVGAHSFFDGKRYSYKPNVSEYVSAIQRGTLPNREYEDENRHSLGKMDEYVMLRMRLSDGVNRKEFEELFGESFLEAYPKAFTFLSYGYIVNTENAYRFTPKGFFVSNYILTEILNF